MLYTGLYSVTRKMILASGKFRVHSPLKPGDRQTLSRFPKIWVVYNGKPEVKINDLEVNPHSRRPPYGYVPLLGFGATTPLLRPFLSNFVVV